MCHPGEIFSPSRLLDEVWDYPSDAGSPDLVRVHIKNLRERIEEDPKNRVLSDRCWLMVILLQLKNKYIE